MNKAKVVFALAGVALIGAIVCFLAFLFLPAKNNVKEQEPAKENVQAEEVVEEEDMEEAAIREEALQEIERFQSEYDMTISLDEMMKQVRIRKNYEAKYHKTYDLEEVFLIENGGDEGDPEESEEYMQMVELIQAYVNKYYIDEAKYSGMTLEEELNALRVEYGELENETDSAYYTPQNEESGTIEENGSEEAADTQEEAENDQ